MIEFTDVCFPASTSYCEVYLLSFIVSPLFNLKLEQDEKQFFVLARFYPYKLLPSFL